MISPGSFFFFSASQRQLSRSSRHASVRLYPISPPLLLPSRHTHPNPTPLTPRSASRRGWHTYSCCQLVFLHESLPDKRRCGSRVRRCGRGCGAVLNKVFDNTFEPNRRCVRSMCVVATGRGDESKESDWLFGTVWWKAMTGRLCKYVFWSNEKTKTVFLLVCSLQRT